MVRVGVLLSVLMALTLVVSQAQLGYAALGVEGFRVLSFSQQDRDGDGQPDLTVLEASFATGRDRVLVYDGGQDMGAVQDWRGAVDFANDTWVFEPGAAGRAALIIVFSSRDGKVYADLYDDQDGDKAVAHRVQGRTVAITESRFPSVSVTGLDGWWLRDDMVSFNLDIEVKRQVRATFTGELYLAAGLPFRGDGSPTIVIRVRDHDHNGIPDYDWRNVYPPPPDSRQIWRTELTVSALQREHPISGFLFWPHLGTSRQFEKDYGQSFPAVQVDWAEGKITYLAEVVTARWNDGNWFVYSLRRVEPETLSSPNFENPFAFYDLADDHDGVPELLVRAQYELPRELHPRFNHPMEYMRYSWDQDNNTSWDYKVELIGRHLMDDTVEFPEFAIKTVPYAQYPRWVMEKHWDGAALVVPETPMDWSSEGIATVGMYSFAPYVRGETVQPNLKEVVSPAVGLRVEYWHSLQQQPWLYFSPVDRRLHLRDAVGGQWDIDGRSRLEYTDTDNDGYFDQWTLGTVVAGEFQTLRGLYVGQGQVILYGDDRVQIKAAAVPTAVFEALPPTDHASWQDLGDRLAAHQAAFAGNDLPGMMAQFQGTQTTLTGASVRDLRAIPGGFRFVLTVHDEFGVESEGPAAAWLAALQPGDYLVTYRSDTGYHTAPLTPPQPTVTTFEAITDEPHITALAPVQLRVTLANTGLDDAPKRQVSVVARRQLETAAPPPTATLPPPRRGDPNATLISEHSVTLLSGEPETLQTLWVPPVPGLWAIHVSMEPDVAGDPGPVLLASKEVRVVAPVQMDVWQSLSAGGIVSPWGTLILIAAMISLGTGLIILVARSISDDEQWSLWS